MKTILFTLLILASNYGLSQTLDGVDLSDIDADYIEITVNPPGLKQRYVVDYGKARNLNGNMGGKFGGKEGEFKIEKHAFLNDEGLDAKLKTPMAVVNFMCNYGQYDIHKAFFTKGQDGVIRTYILKKA